MNKHVLHPLEDSNEEMEFLNGLHPIFETVLDTYNSVSEKPYVTGHITLWDALQKIRYNLGQDVNPKLFLTNKYVDGKKNPVYDRQKVQQPAVCYNASFNAYKALINIKTIHNLMFLDIDEFDSREQALAYKHEIVNKYDWILACSLSLSKLGLHIIIWVDKIRDNQDFNKKYDYISKTYFDKRLDPKGKSLSRFTVLPYDINIYINYNPIQLPIDYIISESLSSVYIGDTDNSQQKNTKSLGSVRVRKIIYTTQTFSATQNINEMLMTSAKQNGLVFKPVIDENLFADPNKPLFFPEGIEVIEINLFLYKHNSIPDGNRTSFIGAMTTQMIFLNVETKKQVIPDVRESILRFIMYVNNKYCSPPLTYNEVLKSYNSNWKRYENGDMDFSSYFRLKQSLWSPKCTLTGNQKRSKTMKNVHGYKRWNQLNRLKEIIQGMADNGEKITQQTVLEKIKSMKTLSLGIYKIKTLWVFLKPSILMYKKGFSIVIDIDYANPEIIKLMENLNIENPEKEIDDDVLDVGRDAQEYYKNILKPERNDVVDEKLGLDENQMTIIYNRIYSNFLSKLTKEQEKQLQKRFHDTIKSFTLREQRIIIYDLETASNDDYWTHCSLENRLQALAMNL